MEKKNKKFMGRPSDFMKQFGISNGTLERVLSLFPEDGNGLRWTELKNKCTGKDVDPEIRMSKQTLSKGLEILKRIGVIVKEDGIFNGEKAELYRRCDPHEVVRYKIYLPSDEYEKMVWKYSELEEAKIWLSEATDLDYEVISDKIKNRALARKNIDESRSVMLPLPENDDEKENEEWEEQARENGVKPGQIFTHKGITGTYLGDA